MRHSKGAIAIWILLGACGCAKRSTGARPIEQQPQSRACLEGSRRPLDGCNDCVCDTLGNWQCSRDVCASCPDLGPGSSAQPTWMRNANASLCCQAPASILPSGWQSTTELECDQRIAPGLWRPPPVAAAGEVSLSEVAVEFAPRAIGLNAPGKAAVADAARKARALESEPVRVRPIVVIGETPHPVLDEELGRARAGSVRQELIRSGVDAKRVKLEALERVRDRSVGMVRIGVKQPAPAATSPEIGCVDGVSLLAAIAASDSNIARLEVCRNDTCAALRVDLGHVRGSARAMLFALPAPLAGGIRVEQKAAGFELVVRINGDRESMHDGDVYRIRLRALDRSGPALGFSAPVNYGSWSPNASKPEACLDAQVSATLAPK